MKNFKGFTFILLFTTFSLNIRAQNDINGTKQAVNSFFTKMNTSDTSGLRMMFAQNAVLQTLDINDKSAFKLGSSSINGLITSIGNSKSGDFHEAIDHLKVENHNGIYKASMDYTFDYKGKRSHCGVNVFTMVYVDQSWKITHIIDTRSKLECDSDVDRIHALIDGYHKAAADADSLAYFSKMTDDAYYLGTDSMEVWSKAIYEAYAAPYFAKGKTWNFKRTTRNIYPSDFNDIRWFDETLDTWMGVCRGSGVVQKVNGEWLIKHYVLSIAVPNDKVKGYLKLLGK